MKNLVLAAALWFAAAGVAGTAMAADKAMEDKKAAPAATKAPADTKAAAKDAAPKAGTLMVNINTATKDELKMLKGIGDTRAQDIIDYRKKNGNFKSVDDLEKVKGVGPGTMKQIRANVTVSGQTMVAKKAEPAAKDSKAAAKPTEDSKAKK